MPHLGASLRTNDTLRELRLIRERGHVVTLDVQRLTGRSPKEKINLCPSLDAAGKASGDAGKANEGDADEGNKELLDRVCVALIGDLLSENKVVHTLRLNPGSGTEGGMAVQYLNAAKDSSLRTLDLNGIKLGDRGAPELFTRLQAGMCSMLTMLCLRSNAFNDLNLETMVTALASDHCALTALDLSDNPSISSEMLLKALMGNRTLTSLSLCGCPKLTEDVEKIGLFLGHEMCSCPVGFIKINLPIDLAAQKAAAVGSTGDAAAGASPSDSPGGRRPPGADAAAAEPAEPKKAIDPKAAKDVKVSKVGEIFSITENDKEVSISNPRALDLFVGLLRWNKLIRKVDLSSVLVENAKAIEFALNTNQVLEELDISHNSLHEEREALAIISGVTSSVSLKLIALDGKPLPIDQLRGEAAQPLVDFSEYSLDVLSARVVASLLSNNHSLVQLFMQSNHLCAVGVDALATSLAHSPARQTLKVLDLSRNSIGSTATPELTGERENILTEIFNALGELTNLEHLLLDENEIESISCLHQLKNLRKLSLKSNRLRSLPNEMGILKTLQDLNLQDNQITRLPRHIGGLRAIQRLDLKSNDLAALPAAIGKLTSLKALDISDNRRISQLPRTMYDLSKELKLMISQANRGLVSPPYAAVKSGIPEMRKWWDLNESSKPAGESEAVGDDDEKAADEDGNAEEGAGSSLPGRVSTRRPMRKTGDSSRHVWAEHESEPVLVINFYNSEMGEIVGDLHGLPVEREAEILMTNEEVGMLKAAEYGGQTMDERIKLHNTWQNVECDAEATIGFSTRPPTFKMIIDWRAKNPGYLQIMPHLGYACAVGMRLEFRQPAYQVDVQKTTYTTQVHSGCATVVEVKGSDVVSVRFDNSEKTLDLDASPSVVTPSVLPNLTIEKGDGNKQAAKAAAAATESEEPQWPPLLVLHGSMCVDAQIIEKVPLAGGGPLGSLYKLRICKSRIAEAGGSKPEETGEEVEMDLNRYNHSVLRHFGSVAEYEAARCSYCDILTREFSTVLETYSNIANVPVKYQSVYVELVETPTFVPRRLLAEEAVEDGGGGGAKKKKNSEMSAQEVALAAITSLRNMKDVVDLLVDEPSEERTKGAHWALPLQVCSYGKNQVDRDWLLKNTVYSLARRLGDASDRVARAGVQLVPFVVSTLQLGQIASRSDEDVAAALTMVAEGQMLRNLIVNYSARFTQAHRNMLLQALEMCALIVVIKNDSRATVGTPALKLITAFLQLEMASSGNRLIIISAEDGETPLHLSPEIAPTFRTRALSLNFIDVGLSDVRATELLKGILTDYDSGEKSRSRLIESISLAGNGLSKVVSTMAGQLISHPRCRLTSLDLSFNKFEASEWLGLAEIVGKSSTLTFLDMRSSIAVPDSVFGAFGEELLRSPSMAALCYIRCNAFDVLRGAPLLRFEEQTLDRGCVLLLAGVLSHNVEVTSLDLTASGVDDEGVAHLGRALAANPKLPLERISLRHNLIAAPTRTALGKAAEGRTISLVVEY